MSEQELKLIGKGRSSHVYKFKENGVDIARKEFSGTPLTNFILTVFYGAPLDYMWCKPAAEASMYRRKVLSDLLKLWLPNRLTIADATRVGLNKKNKMLYMDTIFIKGSPAALHSPFSKIKITEYEDLKYGILPNLQKNLRKSGMIGTIWQTGYGQPCAIPNFLRVKDEKTEEINWIWIDAESGVPAIVSYDIPKLLKFYIPQALKKRRVLFDDVDADVFKKYIDNHTKELTEVLGEEYFKDVFMSNVDKFLKADASWHSETRSSRSMNYFEFKGKINKEEKEYYSKHKIKWQFFLMKRIVKKIPKFIIKRCVPKLLKYFIKLNPISYLLFFMKSIFIKNYRIKQGREFVSKKISEWYDLGRLTKDESDILQTELHNEETNQYLADFGVFLAFKPFGYFVKLFIAPMLLATSVISNEVFVLIIAFYSIGIRTLYASLRFIEDAILHRSFPFIAILVAPIPTFGTLAYPCQMLHTARKEHKISQFIIYEICSTIAKKIPIFGGDNSEIEYLLNKLAFLIIKTADKPNE